MAADDIETSFVGNSPAEHIDTGSRYKKLINWGYAVCDAAIRKYVDDSHDIPANFPYPEKGIGQSGLMIIAKL